MWRTATITQYCNISGHCPGTLNQDFDTAEHAAEVAKWWGYTPEIVPHVHSS